MSADIRAAGGPVPAAYLPADKELWMFIVAELAMFGAFFIAFMISRVGQAELFDNAQLTLNVNLGAVNTILLVSSSWAVAAAVSRTRRNEPQRAAPLLLAAMACSVGFMVIKVVEYNEKLAAGHTILTNDFYMYFYCLTMIHLAHVLAGTIILFILYRQLRAGRYGTERMGGLEAGATYWHLVDLLWIFLFTLLYVLR